MLDNINRGPFYKSLDKLALAHQSQTGDSYEKSFTHVYTDPRNAAIVDASKYDDLTKAFDATYGTAKSLIPVAKTAPAYDPLAKAAEMAEHLGPNHARLHSLAVDHMRAHSGMSYESAYSHLYSRPENVSLRNAVKAEHMKATIAGVARRRLPTHRKTLSIPALVLQPRRRNWTSSW